MRTRNWVGTISVGIAVLGLILAWRTRLARTEHTALNSHEVPATSRLSSEFLGDIRNPLANGVAAKRPVTKLARVEALEAEVGANIPDSSDRNSNAGATASIASVSNADISTTNPSAAKRMIPKYWRLTADGFGFITESQVVHSGSYGAVLNSEQDQGIVAVFQTCSAAGFRGKRVKFRIFLLGGDEFGAAKVWIRVDDPTQPVQGVEAPANLQSGSDWKLGAAEIPVSLNATVLTYGVTLNGRGPLWMDSAALEIADQPRAVIDVVASGQNSKLSPLTIGPYPSLPENMDFEEFVVSPQ